MWVHVPVNFTVQHLPSTRCFRFPFWVLASHSLFWTRQIWRPESISLELSRIWPRFTRTPSTMGDCWPADNDKHALGFSFSNTFTVNYNGLWWTSISGALRSRFPSNFFLLFIPETLTHCVAQYVYIWFVGYFQKHRTLLSRLPPPESIIICNLWQPSFLSTCGPLVNFDRTFTIKGHNDLRLTHTCYYG